MLVFIDSINLNVKPKYKLNKNSLYIKTFK